VIDTDLLPPPPTAAPPEDARSTNRATRLKRAAVVAGIVAVLAGLVSAHVRAGNAQTLATKNAKAISSLESDLEDLQGTVGTLESEMADVDELESTVEDVVNAVTSLQSKVKMIEYFYD
jgi:peptidoglycan hydrolase CwlO-like protein